MDYHSVPLNDIAVFIQWLDELFPNQCPDPADSERDIWIKAGKRKAAEILQSKLRTMQNKIL